MSKEEWQMIDMSVKTARQQPSSWEDSPHLSVGGVYDLKIRKIAKEPALPT
ncbi:MAG: hypothetical protein SVY15_08965 [Halobacteriota archaeon]|nr:hypothetical protein [Halobacteriota archaeon]